MADDERISKYIQLLDLQIRGHQKWLQEYMPYTYLTPPPHKHYKHNHNLQYIIPYYGYGWVCDVCRHNSKVGSKSYHCQSCKWDICETCFEYVSDDFILTKE